MSEKEIGNFKLGLSEGDQDVLDEIAEFGLFLKERVPKNTEYIPIRGENYYRVTDLSLTQWQSQLINYIREHGEAGKLIPIVEIFPNRASNDKESKYPDKKSTIDLFLRDFRFLGKYKIADLRDLNEGDMEAYDISESKKKKHQRGSRTRRLYGIVPRLDFLNASGKVKDTDLL